jgi:NAD(P)-dependent dehydrogenase (short-subunit alcohol dehydrogenase family)
MPLASPARQKLLAKALLRQDKAVRAAESARRSARCDVSPLYRERLTVIGTDLASLKSSDRACDDVIRSLGSRCIDALALNAGIQTVSNDAALAELVPRLKSARDIDNQCGSSVAALVLGRHVGCERAGLPKSNRRQLTWLHAGPDKML